MHDVVDPALRMQHFVTMPVYEKFGDGLLSLQTLLRETELVIA